MEAVAASFRAMAKMFEQQAARLESVTSNLADSAAPAPTRRRARPKRDPRKPKRPKNAYLLFAEHAREELRKEGFNMGDVKNVMREIGGRWRNTLAPERKPFEDAANELKKQHAVAMETYNEQAAHDDDDKEDADEEQTDPAPKRRRTVSQSSAGHDHEEEDLDAILSDDNTPATTPAKEAAASKPAASKPAASKPAEPEAAAEEATEEAAAEEPAAEPASSKKHKKKKHKDKKKHKKKHRESSGDDE